MKNQRIRLAIILVLLIFIISLLLTSAVYAETDRYARTHIKDLEQQVKILQRQVGDLQSEIESLKQENKKIEQQTRSNLILIKGLAKGLQTDQPEK